MQPASRLSGVSPPVAGSRSHVITPALSPIAAYARLPSGRTHARRVYFAFGL